MIGFHDRATGILRLLGLHLAIVICNVSWDFWIKDVVVWIAKSLCLHGYRLSGICLLMRIMKLFFSLKLAVVLEAHRSIAQSNAGQDRQTFSVQDRQASAAQVCDDPCLLCDLLMEHMLKG